MTAPLRLLADDLSGALDTLTELRLPGMGWPALAVRDGPVSGAVALTIDTRDAGEERAHARVRRASPWLSAARPSFKKIDSSLRGPVAAELAALDVCDPGRRMVVAPALPAQARAVRAGRVITRGAAQPVDPAGDLARFGHACRFARPGDKLPGGISLWDAENDDDLDHIAAEARADGADVIVCGSAGLAGAARRVSGGTPSGLAGVASPVLVLAGSDHPVTHRRIAALTQTRTHPVHRIDADGAGAAPSPIVWGAAAPAP